MTPTQVTGGRVVAQRSPPIALTIPFMLLALLHLAALQVWLMLHPAVLTSAGLLGGSQLLVAVHLFTLGFGSLLIAAALHQLVPAVLDAPLRSLRVAAGELVALALGSDTLIAGFAAGAPWVLAIGGTLLAAAVLSMLVHLGLTLKGARQRSITGWYLAAALLHLALVATMGVLLVFTLQNGWLGLRTGAAVLAHLALGLGGWLGLAVVGASYRLVPMFTGSNAHSSRVAEPVLLTLVVTIPLLASALLLGAPGWLCAALAGVLALALAAYGADLWRMIADSRRPHEASGRFARAAILALWAGLLTGLAALITVAVLGTGQLALAGAGPLPVVRLALISVYLLTVGWIGTLALGQLHMILPFLVWLQLYKPLAGKVKVPMLTDLQASGVMTYVWWSVVAAEALTVTGIAGGWRWPVATGGALGAGGLLLMLAGQLRMLYLGIYAFRTGTNPVGGPVGLHRKGRAAQPTERRAARQKGSNPTGDSSRTLDSRD